MKKLTKYFLAGITMCLLSGFGACDMGTSSNSASGPQFLEGSLETIKISDNIVISEYVDYVTDSDYKIEIVGEDGKSTDVTGEKIWIPQAPGKYTIVYTVFDGANKGEAKFELSVIVPRMTWSYTINNDFYDYGENIIFEEFFNKMNIAAISYYDWKMVMDSVTVDGETTTFDESDTSYTVESFSEHFFKYHIETADGQIRYADQYVGIRYVDEETLSYLEANNMVEHNAITVAEGRVVLNNGEYGGGNTTGAPRASMPNEQAYLAYTGDYGLNDFVAFDYTGNNMPAIGFFVDQLKDTMFYCNQSEPEGNLDKGVVVANGVTQNNGAVFSKWTASVCSRLGVYGPRKIANMDNDTDGWFRNSIKGVDQVGMTWQANNPDTKLRMVAGFIEGTDSYMTLAYYLCNRETGEVYYKGTLKTTFDASTLTLPIDENYYKGNIVAWGHYGKKTAFDAIYPVVHADSLDAAIETFFPLSKFQETAQTRVQANETLRVSDYIVTLPDAQYTLNLIDEAGKVTPITGDTFTLAVGSYTLQYNDGKNDTAVMSVQASNISAAGQAWLTDNNVTYNRLNSISDDGKIVLGAGTTSASDGRPTETTVNDYAYLAFNNDYKLYKDGADVGAYICIEYTGNNMPNVLFFGDEITNNIFVGGEVTGNKGMLYSNGCTLSDGSLFSGWETSVNNRLNLYGPNKVKNMGRDFEGFNRWLIKSAWLGMTQQAQHENTKFRLTLGFIELRETENAQYVKATIHLENAETGERYYGGTAKLTADLFISGYTYEEGKTTFSDYFAGGKIAVYGQIGKTTTIDKLYAPTQYKAGGIGDEVFGAHSKFNSEADINVHVDDTLKVSDYIITESGYTPTLRVIDADGVATVVTGDTIKFDKTGKYLLSYCDGKNLVKAITIDVVSIRLNETSVSLVVGDSLQLSVDTEGLDGEPIAWSSSDNDVVEVDETGKVTAVSKGIATITVKVGEQWVTCEVKSCEKYEISTVEQFMAMPTGDELVYCVLTQDIDFAGTLIVANDKRTNATETYYKSIGATEKFSGVLDGNGKRIYNVTVLGEISVNAQGVENANGVTASVFNAVDGTIKNLSVQMAMAQTYNNLAVTGVKDSGFIRFLYAGGLVENCYVEYASHLTQYTINNGKAIAAIAANVNAAGGSATIRNCVGVMNLSGGVTHPNAPFGGAATIVGGLNSAESTAHIENCYGVMLTAANDTVHTAKIDSKDTSGNFGTVKKETSSVYSSMYDMYAAAKTGMTAENGWNNFWSLKDGVLKFGDETIFEVYEISSVADFMALPMDDASAYCVLTKDIDFTGIVINQTAGYMTVGYPEGAVGQVTPTEEAGAFAGVLDGNGYALKNVTIAPLEGYAGSNTCLGAPNLIYAISGTVKNLSVHVSLTGVTVNSARFGGFARTLSAGADISNCYFELTSTHYVASNYPLAPLAGFISANIGAINIENCVGVLNAVPNSRNGGLAGGLVGRISMANGGTVNIQNCYAVEVAPNDNTTSAQVYVQLGDWQAPTVNNNNFAYTTLAELLAAAATGMTAENGWNNFWTVTDTALQFGGVTVA